MGGGAASPETWNWLFWSRPSTPATRRVTMAGAFAGNDRAVLLASTDLPSYAYRRNVVPKTFSTWAVVPVADRYIPPPRISPGLSPAAASQSRTLATSAAAGE